MWMTELPPFVPFFVAGMLAIVIRGHARQVLMLLVPVIGGVHLLTVEPGVHWQLTFLDYTLTPYRADRLSLMFGYLFHLAAFLGFLFALNVRDTMQQVAALVYAGSALGAVFAGDLISLFVFWELLALSSVFLIWARRTPRALSAGFRYLIIQVLSGVLLLAGAVIYYHDTGSLTFDYIGLNGPAAWLIFLAFGIKCAFPLLHSWLIDAYPEATPTGTVLLSSFTTKVAVYALARGFAGTELLIYIGTIMTCFPIFYAVIENDLRRVLAYSTVNQLGFMVCGIGIGTALAVNGAVAHAFTDLIFKALLFMSMGAVLHMTGRIKGSDLGGLYKTMPITTVLCIVGAASISAVPLFSGFVSKSMIMSAVLEEGHPVIWLVLLFASAGVLEHAGIKIPFFAFFAHDSGLRPKEPPLNMLIAMALAAVLCVAIGSYPSLLYNMLPFALDYLPYDGAHVISQLQLLTFAALGVFWLMRTGIYPPELPSVNLDADWVYRRFAPGVLSALSPVGHLINSSMRRAAIRRVQGLLTFLWRHHGPHGVLARGWPTGSMVLWVAVLLAMYLIIYYV